MQTDIQSRQDIELLVDTFYDVVKADGTIGFIFHDIIGDDWSHHLPVMYQFWETVLLGKAGYSGNPVQKHIAIDKNIKLLPEHFDRWQSIWNSTVDSLYAGAVAEDAKKKAATMIQLMSMKIDMARDNKFIS
mgnify:CR=1 FL=1